MRETVINQAQHPDYRATLTPTQLKKIKAMHCFPNFFLFAELNDRENSDVTLNTVVFSNDFAAIANTPELMTAARNLIPEPSADASGDSSFKDLSCWCPTPFSELDDEFLNYNCYKLLVLRIAHIARWLQCHHNKVKTPDSEVWRLERQLYFWYDAHIFMTLAIDALGFIPTDDSPAMHIILNHYAPDINMAFTEGDMPVLDEELEQVGFFEANERAAKVNPFVKALSKACPFRCEVRETSSKAADSCVKSRGFFGFLKVALAAMFLGTYNRSRYRPGLPMRRDVYELFFFFFDARLLPYRVKRKDGTYGGTPEALKHDFDVSKCVDHAQTKPTAEGTACLSQYVYVSYEAMLATRLKSFSSGPVKSKTKAGNMATTNKTAIVNGIKESDFNPQVHGGTGDDKLGDIRRASTRVWKRMPQRVSEMGHSDDLGDMVKTEQLCFRMHDPESRNKAVQTLCKRMGWALDSQSRNSALLDGLVVSRTVGRLSVEQRWGQEMYERRKHNKSLPLTDMDYPETCAPPPPPHKKDELIKYSEAVDRSLACDWVLPTALELAKDSIIMSWFTTSLFTERTTASNKLKHEREYIFQLAVTQALREYIIFGLAQWCSALRHKLNTRARWASWEEVVHVYGDTLRCDLDSAYLRKGNTKGEFLTAVEVYQATNKSSAQNRPANTHCERQKERFLSLIRHYMTTHLISGLPLRKDDKVGPLATKPVDHVVPLEYTYMIRHALRTWRYSKTARPIDLKRLASVQKSNAPIVQAVMPAQLPYMVVPVFLGETPEFETDAETRQYIQDKLVGESLFPLSIFGADKETMVEFSKVRSAYHTTSPDTAVRMFVRWLAKHSVFQFHLLRVYLEEVHRFINIRTIPLPRHIVDYQVETLRKHHCIPEDQPLPQHLLTTMVCLGCCKVTAYIADTDTNTKKSAAAMPIGNADARYVTVTNDDVVFARVRQRFQNTGEYLLRVDQCKSAPSWSRVVETRSMHTTDLYDEFVDDPHGVLRIPSTEAYNLRKEREAKYGDSLDDFIDGLFSEELNTDDIHPFDRSTLIYHEDGEVPNGRMPRSVQKLPLKLVATGEGQLGELAFGRKQLREVDRRLRILNACGNKTSFHLHGHNIDGVEANYDFASYADSTRALKVERKKWSALVKKHYEILDMPTSTKRQKKNKAAAMAAWKSKRIRDGVALCEAKQCSGMLMVEINLLGNALIGDALQYGQKSLTKCGEDLFLLCCYCVSVILASKSKVIGDRCVCSKCYAMAMKRGGKKTRRAIRGESTRRAAGGALTMVSNLKDRAGSNISDTSSMARHAMSNIGHEEEYEDDEQTQRAKEIWRHQRRMSPSSTRLCPLMARKHPCYNELCVMTPAQKICAIEVLDDSNPGAPRFAYLYACMKHAKCNAALWRGPTIPLRSEMTDVLEGRKRSMGNVTTNYNLLDQLRKESTRPQVNGNDTLNALRALRKHSQAAITKTRRTENKKRDAARKFNKKSRSAVIRMAK